RSVERATLVAEGCRPANSVRLRVGRSRVGRVGIILRGVILIERRRRWQRAEDARPARDPCRLTSVRRAGKRTKRTAKIPARQEGLLARPWRGVLGAGCRPARTALAAH